MECKIIGFVDLATIYQNSVTQLQDTLTVPKLLTVMVTGINYPTAGEKLFLIIWEKS